MTHLPRRLALAALVGGAACRSYAWTGVQAESGEWSPGTAPHQVAVGAVSRGFLLHVPPRAPATMFGLSPAFPLIIVLHGSGGSAEDVQHASRFDSVADVHGFLVAYPNGTKGALGISRSDWNAGACCGAAQRDNVDDVGFIHELIERVATRLPLDRQRIYVAGFSDGGRMAYHIACTGAGPIAAIAVVSGSLLDPNCRPARPVPVVAFHGTADGEVAYDDSALTRPARPLGPWAAALPSSIRFWAAHDGCRAAVQHHPSPNVTQTVIAPCRGADIVLYTIDGGVHGWPGEPPGGAGSRPPMSELDATNAMTRFLLGHALR